MKLHPLSLSTHGPPTPAKAPRDNARDDAVDKYHRDRLAFISAVRAAPQSLEGVGGALLVRLCQDPEPDVALGACRAVNAVLGEHGPQVGVDEWLTEQEAASGGGGGGVGGGGGGGGLLRGAWCAGRRRGKGEGHASLPRPLPDIHAYRTETPPSGAAPPSAHNRSSVATLLRAPTAAITAPTPPTTTAADPISALTTPPTLLINATSPDLFLHARYLPSTMR